MPITYFFVCEKSSIDFVYHAQVKTANQTQTLQIHPLSSTCCLLQISKTPNCFTIHALVNLYAILEIILTHYFF